MPKVYPSVSSEVHKSLSLWMQTKPWVSQGCLKQYSTWSQSKTLFHPSTLFFLPYMKVIAVKKTIPAWSHLQSRALQSVSPGPWPLTAYSSTQFKQLHFHLRWLEAARRRQLKDPWINRCWTQIHLCNGDKQEEHSVPFQKECHRLELKCKTGFNWIVTKTHPCYQLLINVRLKSVCMFVNVRHYQELPGPLILSAPTSLFPGRLRPIKQCVHALWNLSFILLSSVQVQLCTQAYQSG